MKTKIYIGLIALLAGFVFYSCTSDEMETDKGSESLVLSVSSKVVVLDQLMSDREAFHFAWTAGSNYGTDSRISYMLEMDLKGNNFAGGLKEEIGATDSRLLAFTHKALNDMAAEVWGSSLDEELEFEARVTAVVSGHEELTQVSSVVTFKLTPYIERYLNLWMIGGATSGGWSLGDATPMEFIEDEPNGFVWEGALVVGELKFILQRTSFTPSFNKDGDEENKLVYRESDDDPDEKFVISTPSNYRIKLNLSTLDIEITDLGGEFVYPSLWMIGDATVGGWSLDNATKMTSIPDEPNGFMWEGELKKGELKFVPQQGDFNPSFGRDGDAANKLIYRADDNDGPDNKFIIKRGATYRIKLNLGTLAIEITNLDGEEPTDSEYWVVGSAAGEEAIAMTKDESNPSVFTYTGELQDGTFRIAKDKEGTETVTGEEQAYESKYTLTYNTGEGELTVEQMAVLDHIWLIGEAAPSGWGWDNIAEMTRNTSNKNEFVYEGNLNGGQLKFPIELKPDFSGQFIVANSDNEGVTDTFEGPYYINPTEKEDNKWYINTPGDFKIVINTYKKRIHFQKK